ncbi:MAG: nucleotidyltransferase family protein [Pyrinomonadaceae bacterium]|nr:nucleotidyltransferase family protein [Phycisphaerales bacterium]
MSLSRREEILEVLRRSLSDLASRYDVASLRLFGSAARGEDTEHSDIDLVVSFRSAPTFDRYMDLLYALEDLLGAPIDLVTTGSLKPRLEERVHREGVLVA